MGGSVEQLDASDQCVQGEACRESLAACVRVARNFNHTLGVLGGVIMEIHQAAFEKEEHSD
jgi:hypothetical protein